MTGIILPFEVIINHLIAKKYINYTILVHIFSMIWVDMGLLHIFYKAFGRTNLSTCMGSWDSFLKIHR